MSQAHLITGGNDKSRWKKILEIYNTVKPNQDPGTNPDTQILTTETTLKIEDIRNLSHLLSLKPYHTPPKTAIVIQTEKLTLEAQGAFLKLLEEPPGETVFILAVDNLENLLPTMVSRCRLIYLPAELKIDLSEKEIKENRDSLETILKSSAGERIKFTEKMKSREEAQNFCQIQLFLWRERLLKNHNLETVAVIREIQKTLDYLSANVNPRLTVENLLLDYPRLTIASEV